MTARRVLVIWNPNAGTKAGLPTNLAGEPELREALEQAGVEFDLVRTDSGEAARTRVAAALDEGWDVIAAAGGDGTAYAIAIQLLRRGSDGPVLGLLPLGSAMNLARTLGIPHDVDAAARILADGEFRAIDVGSVRDRPFFEIVAIGLGAEALQRAQSIDRRRHWGAILEFVRLASRYRRTHIRLRLDDDRVVATRGLGLAVANAPTTGMHVAFAPDARLDDGLLEVVLHEGVGPWGLVATLLRAVVTRPRGRFRSWRTRRIAIEARRPLAVYADGQDIGTTPVTVSLDPAALRVVAPRIGERGDLPVIAGRSAPTGTAAP